MLAPAVGLALEAARRARAGASSPTVVNTRTADSPAVSPEVEDDRLPGREEAEPVADRQQAVRVARSSREGEERAVRLEELDRLRRPSCSSICSWTGSVST